eukprot:403336160
MRSEMLEHDYFDTEILFHGQKNPRLDDHLREHRDILSENDIQEVKNQLKEDLPLDGERYTIMEIEPGYNQKLQKMKNRVKFVYIPTAMIVMPLLPLCIPSAYAGMLIFSNELINVVQLCIGFHAVRQIQKFRKTVMGIDYQIHEDKIIIKKQSPLGSKIKEESVDPQDIQKVKKQILGGNVGYENLKTNNNYITENTSLWYDKQFFDSIIHQIPIVSKRSNRVHIIPRQNYKPQDEEKKKQE